MVSMTLVDDPNSSAIGGKFIMADDQRIGSTLLPNELQAIADRIRDTRQSSYGVIGIEHKNAKGAEHVRVFDMYGNSVDLPIDEALRFATVLDGYHGRFDLWTTDLRTVGVRHLYEEPVCFRADEFFSAIDNRMPERPTVFPVSGGGYVVTLPDEINYVGPDRKIKVFACDENWVYENLADMGL